MIIIISGSRKEESLVSALKIRKRLRRLAKIGGIARQSLIMDAAPGVGRASIARAVLPDGQDSPFRISYLTIRTGQEAS